MDIIIEMACTNKIIEMRKHCSVSIRRIKINDGTEQWCGTITLPAYSCVQIFSLSSKFSDSKEILVNKLVSQFNSWFTPGIWR